MHAFGHTWSEAPEVAWDRTHTDQLRPRTARRINRFLILMAIGAFLAAGGIVTAADADAMPGQCGQGYAFGSGGGFCDGPQAPDGTWMHCETVYVLGFGGTNCFRVRPVPVNVDPRGWAPA
jgi:hypothetical protein